MKKLLFVLITLLLLTHTVYSAEFPKPVPNMFVHDFAGVLAPDNLSKLDTEAKTFKPELQCEVAIVIIQSLNGADQFSYSLDLAREWGVGNKDGSIRGFLILVAIKERKISIRTSSHIEGQITDGFAGEIRRQMEPLFKKGDFYGGLSLALGKFKGRLEQGDTSPPPSASSPESDFNPLWLLFLIFPVGIIGAILFVNSNRKKRQQKIEREEMEYRSEIRPKPDSLYYPPISRYVDKPPQSGYGSRKSTPTKKKDDGYTSSYTPSTPSPAYDYTPSSSYSDSSSSSDTGSSYSGGSDYSGGGSDGSW